MASDLRKVCKACTNPLNALVLLVIVGSRPETVRIRFLVSAFGFHFTDHYTCEMSDSVSAVVRMFMQKFSGEPLVVRAPGRINLIGEHTDYNEGFVLPAAIDRSIYFAMAPSGTDHCNIYSVDMEEGVSFSIHDLNPGETWVNYLMGVLDAFERKGLPVHGVDCVFGGDIPVGGGLSSSAALCNGFGFGLNQLFNCQLDRLALAKVSQYAEHEFAGLLCGLMDQYASLFGKSNAALLLDCRAQRHEWIAIDLKSYAILLIDTKVKHSLASSAYNERRKACEEGVKIIHRTNNSVHSLRDVTPTMLYEHQDKLGQDIFVKCLYVVQEISRTQQAADHLKKGELVEFGSLLFETHRGLSQAYEVSCEELDFLVALAEEEKGNVVGARMMGGGFGGCTINMVRKDSLPAFEEKVRSRYRDKFHTQSEFYLVNLVDGVSVMNVNA